MKIEVHACGRYREVGFFDFEDEGRTAYSGLLDGEEARELAARLREIAGELADWAQEIAPDERQIVLPFIGAVAA